MSDPNLKEIVDFLFRVPFSKFNNESYFDISELGR